MANYLVSTNAIATMQATAASVLHSSADMSLHELVDEFQRLSAVITANTTIDPNADYDDEVLNDTAQVAVRHRQIVNGALRARFGLSLDQYIPRPQER